MGLPTLSVQHVAVSDTLDVRLSAKYFNNKNYMKRNRWLAYSNAKNIGLIHPSP